MNKEQYNFNTTDLGRKGENLAATYLKDKGYTLLCCNYRFKRSEIDIIVIDDNLLVFVEVKYRTNLLFGEPETFINPAKQKRIKMAAENYIFEKNWLNDIRFDVISIVNINDKVSIEHFIDSF